MAACLKSRPSFPLSLPDREFVQHFLQFLLNQQVANQLLAQVVQRVLVLRLVVDLHSMLILTLQLDINLL